MKMEKEMTPNEKRPQQDCGGMFTQVQASVEILSPVPVSGKCSEKDYERLFIRDPEVKAREGKMAYVRPEYHERIMRITRVIGHDRLTLSAYIDHVLTHHFNQCEDAIKSPVSYTHLKKIGAAFVLPAFDVGVEAIAILSFDAEYLVKLFLIHI